MRKLKAGIKCIFTVPACFLILLFFTNSSKIIFLVLWIASLFLIAAYLIHVEYSDYKIQEMVNSLQDSEGGIDSLIDIDSIYTRVSAPKRKLDEKIDTIITNVRSESGADAADDTDREVQDENKTDDTPNEFQNEGSVDETPNETQDKVSDNIEQEEQTP